MSEGRIPPYDVQAEESLLGAMMLTQAARTVGIETVGPEDFYVPVHGTIFAAIHRMWTNGEPVDPITLSDYLRSDGSLEEVGGTAALVNLQSRTPATTSAPRYARIIADHAGLRRVISVSSNAIERAYAMKELEEIIDELRADLASIDVPMASLPDGLYTVEDFMARGATEQPAWVIKDVMRVGYRSLLVAEEGAGKTLVAQQMALCVAKGVHPFTGETIPALRTLLLDAENPEERIQEGFRMVDGALNGDKPDYDHRAYLWHREGGIDIRKRADRAQFERVIAEVRPQLICIGPLYKIYRPGRDGDEQAATEVQGILDDLRVRYGFALFMEHHAPKKQGGYRDLAPYGSSVWLRWPEFGLNLVRDDQLNLENENIHYNIGRFRQDRVRANWPTGISKSPTGLPWKARYDQHFSGPRVLHIDDDNEPF